MGDAWVIIITLIVAGLAIPIAAFDTAACLARGYELLAAVPILLTGLALVTGAVALTFRADASTGRGST